MSAKGDKVSQDKNVDESPSTNQIHREETKPWLENSSLEWLTGTLEFFQTPSSILLVSSIPFCLGAYYGFLQPGQNLEKWVGDVPTTTNGTGGGDILPENQRNVARNGLARRAMQKEAENWAARQLGFQTASKALGIATFVNLGAFSLLGAVGFYLSGCKSISEAMSRTQQWASSRAQSFDEWVGLDNRESKTHPEVLATKNMTEEEELNYVYDRLMKEIQQEDSSDR